MSGILTFIEQEIIAPIKRRATCRHEGETHEHCSKCGADLREVASYECRVCSMMMKPKIYPAEKTPDFCVQCGAPKFTFIKIKKKRAKS